MDLNLPEDWRDYLPDEIKSDGTLNDVKSIDQLAKMVVNGRKLQSTSISIPSADADPERKQQFTKDLMAKVPDLVYVGEDADLSTVYDRMGRPKEFSEYDLGEVPEKLKGTYAEMSQKAHELGMSQKQLQGITDMISSDFNNTVNAQTGALEEDKTFLKTKWGAATDIKLEQAANFAKNAGFAEPFVDMIKSGAMGSDNLLALDALIEGFEGSGGPSIGGTPGSAGARLTPAQAEIEINEIMSNRDSPYWNAGDPSHKLMVDKVVELGKLAEIGKPKTETEKFREALQGRG